MGTGFLSSQLIKAIQGRKHTGLCNGYKNCQMPPNHHADHMCGAIVSPTLNMFCNAQSICNLIPIFMILGDVMAIIPGSGNRAAQCRFTNSVALCRLRAPKTQRVQRSLSTGPRRLYRAYAPNVQNLLRNHSLQAP